MAIRYMYRAIINGNTGEPSLKRVQLIEYHGQKSGWLIEVPSSQEELGSYRILVPISELHEKPEDAWKSLIRQYETKIMLHCDKIRFEQDQIGKLRGKPVIEQ